MKRFKIIVTKKPNPVVDEFDDGKRHLLYRELFSTTKHLSIINDEIRSIVGQNFNDWFDIDTLLTETFLLFRITAIGLNRDVEVANFIKYVEDSYDKIYSDDLAFFDLKSMENKIIFSNNPNTDVTIDRGFIEELKSKNGNLKIIELRENFECGLGGAYESFVIGISSSVAATFILETLKQIKSIIKKREEENAENEVDMNCKIFQTPKELINHLASEYNIHPKVIEVNQVYYDGKSTRMILDSPKHEIFLKLDEENKLTELRLRKYIDCR